MAVYATLAKVQELVEATDSDAFTAHQANRINDLLPVVSALIESETRAVFSNDPAPSESVAIDPDGGPVLWLPKGIRTLTSVVASPDWNGAAWVNGTTLGAASYRLSGQVANGAYQHLVRLDGGWFGRYVVTGVWADRVTPVPAEIIYVANYAAAEVYKKQNAAPSGFAGADGSVVLFRDVFRETEIREILDRWRVGPGAWVAA